MPKRSPSDSEFWNDLYVSRETGWDRGRVAPPIARMLDQGLADGRKLAVPGAGRGHEAIHAARRKLDVTAIDFADEAVEAMRIAAARAGVPLHAVHRDIFHLPETFAGHFGAVLEHASLTAIEPGRRGDYARVMHDLLAPDGLYFGVFFNHGRTGGPPFTIAEWQIRELFTPLFTIERLEVAPDSFPSRAGEELEFVFRRR